MASALPRLFGPYKLLEQIDRLGGATIYLARQTSVDRLVTLTVLPAHEAEKAGHRQRFERQIAAASRLGHPNVVRAIDAGSIDGFQYIAAEYAGGERLSEPLARREWFPTRRCISITLDIARALEHLQSRRILHRSVNPQAIVLADSGVAKLRGFSLSRLMEGDGSETWFDIDAYAARYMAPEAARAQRRIDGRADIYSLGCVAYHLVTGAPPFPGTHALEIQRKHQEDEVPDPRARREGLPEAFSAVLDTCLQKAREDRYRTAAEMVQALQQVAEQKLAAPPPKRTSALRWIGGLFRTP